MGMHIVITGDPASGFSFWGTFKTAGDAIAWAEAECDGPWSIAPLEYPATGEEEA